jgi:hypothetical protein
MSDKPNLPAWLIDFHDQKQIAKGFYFWMHLLDRNQEVNHGRKFDDLHKRREDMCNWIDFKILMVTFVDFLYQHGYRIVRADKNADILETAKAYKEIEEVWEQVEHWESLPAGLRYAPEYKQKILDTIPEWIARLAPPKVIERLKK